jgi:hypothetical protein
LLSKAWRCAIVLPKLFILSPCLIFVIIELLIW